ncbi:MAG: hypothetical protein MJK18_10985, partial [Bdellovibrionales bacterium]|nr:hypothetical protein [Bdellovibrionales bacterium]
KNFLKIVGILIDLYDLVDLRLNGNQLKDISGLSSLTSLELLDASSNRGRLECPLDNPEYCILVDYSRQTSFATAPSTNGERRIRAYIVDLNDQYLALLGGREGAYIELIDKSNLKHIKTNLFVNRRVGATFARISDYEVIASGGWGQDNRVIKYHISPTTLLVTSEIVKKMDHQEYYQESVVLQDGRILITGGYLTNGAVSDVVTNNAYIYHPSTGEFESLASGMREARSDHKMVLANNGLVYIFGGKTYNPSTGERPSNSVEVFNPETNTFSSVNERMHSRRSGHSATLLDDNTVLISGGFEANVPGALQHQVSEEDQKNIFSTRKAELFYIDSESFYELPKSMMQQRANHEAVKLSDGKVLLVGGQKNPANFSLDTKECGVCHKNAEIYDPVKEVFISTGTSMSYSRVHFTMAPLPDNRVYINGGVGEGAGFFSEIFSYGQLD